MLCNNAAHYNSCQDLRLDLKINKYKRATGNPSEVRDFIAAAETLVMVNR